jgi:hypothetical protein
MFEWLPFGAKKPDHPMHSMEAAQALLADLPIEPDKALKELASWLASVTSTSGFSLAERIALVKLLDETGQLIEPEVVRAFLHGTDLKDYERAAQWALAREYWQHLAAAYQLCLGDYVQHTKAARALADELPVLLVRCLRALSNAGRIARLRYFAPSEEAWRALFDVYHMSETAGCDNARFLAYETDTLKTTARCELLRALMLDAACPQSLRSEQVELAARAAARFADSFVFKTAPDTACNWHIDLAQPGPPRQRGAQTKTTDMMRFFGGGVGIGKVDEVIKRLCEKPQEKERRFGDDYSPQQKLLVLRHVRRHWGEDPPRRREARRRAAGEVEIAHGFEDVARTIERVESGVEPETPAVADVAIEGQPAPPAPAPPALETWTLRDISSKGVGAAVPRLSESWVKIGTLCAVRLRGSGWGVGVVRRIYRDADDRAFAGFEILAKRPVSVCLRAVAAGDALTAEWIAADASNSNQPVAILLDASTGGTEARELLVKRGAFQRGLTYTALISAAQPRLRFEELIEEGDDFARVRCAAVNAAGNAA